MMAFLYICMVVWIFHETRQVLRLYEHRVQVRVCQSDAKLNVVGRRQIHVSLELCSRFLDDKFPSVGCRHLLRSPKELPVERQGFGP